MDIRDDRVTSGDEVTFSLTTMSSSPNFTWTLQSLRGYASQQEENIKLVLDFDPWSPYLRETTDPSWKQFYSSAWGTDPDSFDKSEPAARGPDTVDDSLILPDVVPINRDVMSKPDHLDACWRFECERFLIRPEYKEAEEFILSNFGPERAISNLMITDQPGIGLPLYSPITGS